MGDWKMLKLADVKAELYNLAEDIGEKNNLAAKEPERLKALQSAYDEWNATLVPPRWKRGAQGKQKQGVRAKARPRRKAQKNR
jgi:hypothetical protein